MGIVIKSLKRSDSPFQPHLYIFGGSENKEWLKGISFTETVFSKNRLIRNIQNVFTIFICMRRFLKREQPDIVIATHSITCFVLYWIRKLTKENYPIVSWIHFSLNAKNVKKNLLHYADYHLAICEGIKLEFSKLDISKSNVYVVNNPVHTTTRVIKRPKDKAVFLYVGRIEYEGQKRIRDLLDALAGVSGKWRLEVIGEGNDLPLCKEYAEKLNLNNKIIWKGWINQPWEIIKEASALILTSSYEGFGMVLAEAIANGVYCISSDCNVGPRDIIKKNINGQLFKPGDLDQLRLFLQRIVDGQILPDPMEIKKSINQFYIEQYYKNYVFSLNDICNRWHNSEGG
ncbi:glycosyl transferase [Sporolactobacillus putidus]|uniref:Glycosyl transferase n=2 Tax=Sporolactobacillus putidus TaxID=492735 RepID=A0A917W1Q3_9BACL|nr:glycosyl transferase [Sporolactobacillus putidus]